MSRGLSVVMLLLLAQLVGCGGAGDKKSTVPVKGKLLVDGKPHGPASLVFQPIYADTKDNRPPASGKVSSDGSFVLSTYGDGDGAPPGKYEVTIPTASAMTDPAMMGKPSANIATNTVQVEIPSGGADNLEVSLESAKGGRKGGPAKPLGS